ncbi:MAG: sodium-independent anion transporter, partial [Gammaproteobacteria bacterium]|nr:sodium-independent anion transporter [Gammaproteobacteria bacterium]
GSVTSFLERFDPAQDNDDVVIDFARSRVADHSGLEAIDTLADRYLSAGKTLHLVHLSKDCSKLLRRAGSLVEVNVIEDPKYFVADDVLG